jgi:hypothetical protein
MLETLDSIPSTTKKKKKNLLMLNSSKGKERGERLCQNPKNLLENNC